jgi:hypothetical protein
MGSKFWPEKTERKRPHERPRRRWDDNIRMNFKETGWVVVDWINLAQDMDQWRDFFNTVTNLPK